MELISQKKTFRIYMSNQKAGTDKCHKRIIGRFWIGRDLIAQVGESNKRKIHIQKYFQSLDL